MMGSPGFATILLLGLTLGTLLGPAPARAAEDGIFDTGFRLELGVGAVEVPGPGGVAVGFLQHVGLQLALGQRWAIKIEGGLSRGIEAGRPSWAQLGVAAVGLHRFLDDRARLRPAIGAGLRVGALVATPELLGLPTDPTERDITGVPLSPLLLGNVELRLGRALGLILEADAAYVSVRGVSLLHLSQRLILALRF